MPVTWIFSFFQYIVIFFKSPRYVFKLPVLLQHQNPEKVVFKFCAFVTNHLPLRPSRNFLTNPTNNYWTHSRKNLIFVSNIYFDPLNCITNPTKISWIISNQKSDICYKYPLCPSQNVLTNPTKISWINFTVCELWQTVPINCFASSTMIIRKWRRQNYVILVMIFWWWGWRWFWSNFYIT